MSALITPAPWKMRETTIGVCQLIITVEGMRVLEISHESYGVIAYIPYPEGGFEATQAANARLIAAAPNLLSALRSLLIAEGHVIIERPPA